nr:hypothetical protein [Tanacetum cinerariifolium]
VGFTVLCCGGGGTDVVVVIIEVVYVDVGSGKPDCDVVRSIIGSGHWRNRGDVLLNRDQNN